jgi:AcrR family transcriptional regulator
MNPSFLPTTDHRSRLLEGMASAVAEKGYADVTLADIVARANVSRRTFYEHFHDKSDCLLALYEAASERLTALVRETVHASDTWQTQLQNAIGAYLGALQRHPVLLRTLFMEILALGEPGLAARRRASQRLVDLMLETVNQRPRRQGSGQALSPLMAVAVVGGVNELVLQAIEQGRQDQLQTLTAPATALVRAAIGLRDGL